MKISIKNCCHSDFNVSAHIGFQKTKNDLVVFSKVALVLILMLQAFSNLQAQSGGWDASSTNGSPGFIDHGSGVIQLISPAPTGCAASAVQETSTTYNPCSGTSFNNCYQVFFDCPTNDNIGSDAKGDGMAFSFTSPSCTYNINNGLACGGGLGYMGACPKMITVEFDTYSSQGNSGFDATYGGGAAGINDEVALQFDGNASDAGRITSANAGNLEDGQIHLLCINYNPTTHIMTISKDGATILTYDFTGSPYELSTYFGCGGLNQTWSAGKFGATSQATVSNGAAISPSLFTGCTPLPIDLLSFSGKRLNETVVLDWSTANEINNDRFVIERYDNVSSWIAIGEVKGAGNSSTVTPYTFIDYEPFNDVSYYRLRQVDIDGTASYTKVVQVDANAHHISISPNPFDDNFTINTDVIGEAEIKIQDVLGRVVYQTSQISDNGLFNVQPSLSPGTYVVTIQTNTFIEQRKIIKK
jgi:hypothetical protein